MKIKQKSSEQATISYEDWLLESLKDKAEAIAYLRVHLDEYEKSDIKGIAYLSDVNPEQFERQSLEIFRRALENVLKAQSKTGEGND